MSILTDTILYGNTSIQYTSEIRGCVNVYGSITACISNSITTSAAYTQILYAISRTATTYLSGVTTAGATLPISFCSNVYVSGTGIYATTFSGTATSTAKLNSQASTYYAKASSVERWWATGNLTRTVGSSQSVSRAALFDMSSSVRANANATSTLKIGDYVFSQNGVIGSITSSTYGTNSNEIRINITWVSPDPWTCLEEGTMITMADWSRKPIEDVKSGEMIMGYDFENNEPTPAVALVNMATVRPEVNNYYIFSNGEVLNCTEDHEIYSYDRQCYCFARDLKEDEKCLNQNGEIITIKAIHRYIIETGFKQFYHLISSNNTYFANNIMNAHAPINKYNWLRRKYGDLNIPQEIKNILRETTKEFDQYDFLVRNDNFRKKSVTVMKELKTKNNKINKLKQYLTSTDYVVVKMSEGLDVDKNIVSKRQSARDEINKLEEEIQTIHLPEHNKLISEYSELKDDILLTNEEKRSKYFFLSCKSDNKNLNIFKKYYCNIEIEGD